jgi:uncharacterized protein YrrD
MLILGSKLINIPIMGLQTGTRLAITKYPIINPSNLKIIAYGVDGIMLNKKPSFLRIEDVRELSDIGMIIDSNDEFIEIDDVISIRKIIDLKFKLIGLDVIDDAKRKLGKVVDYSIDINSFLIQQLNIKQGIIKRLSNTDLLIHRTQIIEINDYSIVVKSTRKKLEPIVKTEQLNYINPFRTTPAQNSNTIKTN